MPAPAKGLKAAGVRKPSKFTLDLGAAATDGVVVSANFEKYLREKIKVRSIGGKAGNLGAAVKVDREGAKITVTSAEHPKRYIKYLAKKYLKSQQLRDYIRVIAVNKKESKGAYELRYFKLDNEESA